MTEPVRQADSAELGLIGLGPMGRALALNLADHGVWVRGTDASSAARAAAEGASERLAVTANTVPMINGLRRPRRVLLCVPAAEVGSVLGELIPLLDDGDTVVDAGNSDFRLTRQRVLDLAARRLHLVGLGVSGGPRGARRGASLMLGGDRAICEGLGDLLRPIAAAGPHGACIVDCGAGAAGHFTKTVHNGIEYALLQLVCEAYELLRGAGKASSEIASIFANWQRGPLRSYLVGLAAGVLATPNGSREGEARVDQIQDVAGYGGTGVWALQAASDLAVPTPVLAAALGARFLSSRQRQRRLLRFAAPPAVDPPASSLSPQVLESALAGAMICAWDEGIALLGAGSQAYEFGTDAAAVVAAWCGGSILRSELAERVHEQLRLERRVLGGAILEAARAAEPAWRRTVAAGARTGVPLPALASALAYFDGCRQDPAPARLLQALRDAFGSHGYRRIDRSGEHTGGWRTDDD